MTIELPLSSIQINRDARQRRELTGVEELADSISRRGLLHPIIIDENNTLIAGERRFRAHQLLGLPTIRCSRLSDLSDHDRVAIELEENIKRQDISWDDRVRAVQQYHELRKLEEPSWSHEETARELGISEGHVTQQIRVAKELAKGTPLVTQADCLSKAIGITNRLAQRREATVLEQIHGDADADRNPIRCKDFIEWANTYDGPRFNFIHCDFPYGIGASHHVQGAANSLGGYSDTPEDYWNLCKAFNRHLDGIVAEHAHLIFWFSPRYYNETKKFLEEDWIVNPYPLIWTKGNVGALPWPDRGPRNTYEMAFFAYRGDAKIIRAVPNHFASLPIRDTHMSEKSQNMLEHFFRMFVDSTTSMLDPTCGSGSALRAARACGATRLLGLERDPEFASDAVRKYQNEGH